MSKDLVQLKITGDGHQTMLLVDNTREETIELSKGARYCTILGYNSDLKSRLRTVWRVWKFTRKL